MAKEAVKPKLDMKRPTNALHEATGRKTASKSECVAITARPICAALDGRLERLEPFSST